MGELAQTPHLHKHSARHSITITLPLDIAETLYGLVDGRNGSSDDEDLSKQMNIVLKKLDKSISKHYAQH
jgi:hypothetical protein